MGKYGRNYTQAPFERTFCVVREPRERLRSCVNWASAYHGSWEEPMANVAVQVSNGRRNVTQWNDALEHRMPQSWFVWAEDGRVTCDCVISFDKLADLKLPHEGLHRSASRSAADLNRDASFPHHLYAMDSLLYEQARASTDLCYKPTSFYV